MFKKLAKVSSDQACAVKKADLLTVQSSTRLIQGSRGLIFQFLPDATIHSKPFPPSQPIAQFLPITMPQEAFPSKIESHSCSHNTEGF